MNDTVLQKLIATMAFTAKELREDYANMLIPGASVAELLSEMVVQACDDITIQEFEREFHDV